MEESRRLSCGTYLGSCLDLTRDLICSRLFKLSIFISHDWSSWADREPLHFLRDCLIKLGASCFLDDRSIVEHDEIQGELARQIPVTDIMICHMTPAYLKKIDSKTNSGNWIGIEVRTAHRAGVKLVSVNVDEFNPRGLQKEEKAQFEFQMETTRQRSQKCLVMLHCCSRKEGRVARGKLPVTFQSTLLAEFHVGFIKSHGNFLFGVIVGTEAGAAVSRSCCCIVR